MASSYVNASSCSSVNIYKDEILSHAAFCGHCFSHRITMMVCGLARQAVDRRAQIAQHWQQILKHLRGTGAIHPFVLELSILSSWSHQFFHTGAIDPFVRRTGEIDLSFCFAASHLVYCQLCISPLCPNLVCGFQVILTILTMIQCSLYNNYFDAYLLVISFSH